MAKKKHAKPAIHKADSHSSIMQVGVIFIIVAAMYLLFYVAKNYY